MSVYNLECGEELKVTLYGLGGKLDSWSLDELVAAMLRHEVIFAAGDKLVFEAIESD
jgi:hypothetical protein